MKKLAVLLLFATTVYAASYKHHYDERKPYHNKNKGNLVFRDGDVADPDAEDYENFCTKIAEFNPNAAKLQLNPVLERLQNDNLLPSENPNEKAKEICEDPERYSDRVCSYFRKYEMINNLLLDFNLIKDMDIMIRVSYVRMWCRHPECPAFNQATCRIKFSHHEGLPGYLDCTAPYLLEAFNPETTIELRKEIHKLCVVAKVTGPFCLAEVMVAIIDRCQRQEEMSSFLTADEFNKAILLNFPAMEETDPENFDYESPHIPPLSETKVQELYTANLQKIFSLFREVKYAELEKYMDLLPDSRYIVPQCTSMATTGFDESKQRACILGRVMDQVRQFLQILPENKPNLGGEERKILNTRIDYKVYLQQSQIESILGIVQNQDLTVVTITNNLKKEFDKTLGERFQEIKTYFTQVEGFNKEIAKADIGYISGTLNTYEQTVLTLSPEVGDGLGELLKYAISTSSLDLIQKTTVLAMQIADACNPLKAMFGGGSVTDVLGAVDEVTQAIAQVARAGKLYDSFTELTEKTEYIKGNFSANKAFLVTVKAILDKIDAGETSDSSFEEYKLLFIEKYNAYSPGVTKPQLTEMTTYWETVLDEACDVIDGAETAAGATVKSIVAGLGLCWKVKIKAQKLIETYCEIYDFQFDLMDALAAHVRSTTAVNAASDMNSDFNEVAQRNPEEILFYLQQLAGISYIMNQIQRIQAMENYCDVLEYKEGGVRPSVCQGTSTDIRTLIAYVGSGCSSQTLQYKDVPIEPATSGDRAFLNITELFEERSVTFQIPDGQWLVDNNWITEGEKDSAIYLQKFEVYLPTESQSSQEIKVVTKITGGNKLTKENTEYFITPPRPLEYDYAEGRDTVCRQEKISNPYLLCSTDAPAKICPHTPETECVEVPTTLLHGSIFAQWDVRLTGYPPKVAIPDPATNVSVKVGVQLCKMSTLAKDVHVSKKNKPRSVKKHWSKKLWKDSNTKCCGDGQYWDGEQNSCQACPEDSFRRLHGYYCDKNDKTQEF